MNLLLYYTQLHYTADADATLALRALNISFDERTSPYCSLKNASVSFSVSEIPSPRKANEGVESIMVHGKDLVTLHKIDHRHLYIS